MDQNEDEERDKERKSERERFLTHDRLEQIAQAANKGFHHSLTLGRQHRRFADKPQNEKDYDEGYSPTREHAIRNRPATAKIDELAGCGGYATAFARERGMTRGEKCEKGEEFKDSEHGARNSLGGFERF